MSMSKEVPEDVISEILSRVPTRYILRFKSVSKSWYALFQNPNFISKHFQNQSTFSDPSFLFTPSADLTSTADPKVGLIFSDSSDKSIKIPIEIDFPISKQLRVCGSCNGLICLSVSNSSIIILWNPATRVFKDLPISPICRPPGSFPIKVVLGFGFDDIVKDYKVLRFVYYGRDLNQVEIYSLSTNSWREIKSVTFWICESACSVFLTGKFHWSARRIRDLNNNKKFIVCFDFREETFSYIMPPEFIFHGHVSQKKDDWSLVAIKESLAIITLDKIKTRNMFEVWVMKEYGVVSSWTKYWSFELYYANYAKVFCRQLGCGFKGETFLVKNRKLFVYDSDSQKVINLGNSRVDYYSQVFNHFGSLITINGGKVVERTNLSSVVPDPFFVHRWG